MHELQLGNKKSRAGLIKSPPFPKTVFDLFFNCYNILFGTCKIVNHFFQEVIYTNNLGVALKIVLVFNDSSV